MAPAIPQNLLGNANLILPLNRFISESGFRANLPPHGTKKYTALTNTLGHLPIGAILCLTPKELNTIKGYGESCTEQLSQILDAYNHKTGSTLSIGCAKDFKADVVGTATPQDLAHSKSDIGYFVARINHTFQIKPELPPPVPDHLKNNQALLATFEEMLDATNHAQTPPKWNGRSTHALTPLFKMPMAHFLSYSEEELKNLLPALFKKDSGIATIINDVINHTNQTTGSNFSIGCTRPFRALMGHPPSKKSWNDFREYPDLPRYANEATIAKVFSIDSFLREVMTAQVDNTVLHLSKPLSAAFAEKSGFQPALEQQIRDILNRTAAEIAANIEKNLEKKKAEPFFQPVETAARENPALWGNPFLGQEVDTVMSRATDEELYQKLKAHCNFRAEPFLLAHALSKTAQSLMTQNEFTKVPLLTADEIQRFQVILDGLPNAKTQRLTVGATEPYKGSFLTSRLRPVSRFENNKPDQNYAKVVRAAFGLPQEIKEEIIAPKSRLSLTFSSQSIINSSGYNNLSPYEARAVPLLQRALKDIKNVLGL